MSVQAPDLAGIHPLRLARERRNLTQRMLADFVGVGEATIQRAERGLPLRADTRKLLCDFLGLSNEDLGFSCFAGVGTVGAGQEAEPGVLPQEPKRDRMMTRRPARPFDGFSEQEIRAYSFREWGPCY